MSTSATTLAPRFRRALYDAATDLFAGEAVGVTLGPPSGLPDQLVTIGPVKGTQDVATMGPARSREETLTCEVLISCATGGGGEVDADLDDDAYGLMGRLEYYTRVTDTTLGGVVRHCFLTEHVSDGTQPDDQTGGRWIAIIATFTAHGRVRGAL